MALEVSRVDVWAATIEDRPGGLGEKLASLSGAGINLEFMIARRAPDKPGTGVVFLAPIEGEEAVKAAKAAGFKKAESLHSVRLEGPDQPGLGARLTKELAAAAINLRGLSAAALGGRCVAYLALDSDDDAARAADILRKMP